MLTRVHYRACWLSIVACLLGTPLLGQEPRDSLPWSILIDSAAFHDLPVTEPRQVIDLLPGVIETGDARGFSIRGSAPGDAATYIDGALIRSGQRGEADLLLGTNAIRQAWLTTGGLAADVGDAASGAVSFITRAAGERWRGSLHYRSDDVGFDAWGNVGLHRVDASLGGPVRGGLTLFTAVTLNGQQSLDTQKDRDVQAPVYVADGVDTIVHQPSTWGASPTDTTLVAIPRFVQYSGSCDGSSNYDVACQGLRLPFTASGSYAWQGKVQQAYGAGSLLSLTGLASRAQQRDFPGADLYNPSNYTGTSAASYAWILGWTHNLARAAERAMALSVNVSYQLDTRTSSPLTRQSELDSRDPFGGFLLKPLDYLLNASTSHSVRIKDSVYSNVRFLDDRQLQCVQAGEGACQNDVAYLNDNALNSVMPYRMNPYGVEESNLFSLWTAGTDNGLDLSRESRWAGRATLGWRATRSNRVRLGAEYRAFDTERYTDPFGMNSSFMLSIYHEKPVERAAYAEDRLDLGRATIVAGIRYDYYDARAGFPFTPGRVSSFPQLPSDSICSSPTACQVVPGATTPFDPYHPAARYVRAPSHTAWSPRVRAAFRATNTTTLRLSYAQQSQAPRLDLVFANKNTDLSIANRATVFGRDLDFTKIVVAELGVRQTLGPDMVLDIAAYNKRQPSGILVRLVQLPDPLQPTPTRNVYDRSEFRVYTNANFGDLHGVDLRLERRISNLFSGAVAYTYQNSTSLDFLPHSTIAGSLALTGPSGFLGRTSAFATFRFTSGVPYTRLMPTEGGFTLTTPCTSCFPAEPVDASRLPWSKTLDLRVRRGFQVRGRDAFVFLESTNLLNWTNVRDLFTEVGAVAYPAYQKRFVTEQRSRLTNEASSAGVLRPDSSVDFTALGGCANWQGLNNGAYASGPVDCVLLERAEQRFGNGDGVFTPAEYTAAFTAWYNLANAPYQFYGPGRRIRVGAEFSF